MKKILVPTDFSVPAKLATEVATEIAKKAQAEIILLHVIEIPAEESFNTEGQIGEFSDWEEKLFTLKLIEVSKKNLATICKDIEDRGVSVSYKLKMGNPFHGMRTAITDQNVDLVVMGTSGRSKLEEMIVGSNTEKVVRYAKCPVLTVHENSSEANFKNIAYATSMNDDEKQFASVVIDAQQLYGATVHLVRINTPLNFRPDMEVRKQMEKFAKEVGLKDYTINIFNDNTTESGIIHFANFINADLIAMATHGRTGFAHVIAGSVAEDVANHANKPVLTYVTNGKK